jgi:hypothetical protein
VPGQTDWRYCKDCHALFFNGYPDKGRCPGSQGHTAQGLNFTLPYGAPGGSGAQQNWRYCEKCHAMFFDGYADKGSCPAGGGHSAQGINFALPHSVPSTATTQGNWRYCQKCHLMFYDGYGDKGKCQAGGGHSAQGLNFALPYGENKDTPTELKWMGVPLPMLGGVALDEFSAGFRAGAAGQIPDKWILSLEAKILADVNGFKLGYAKGVLSGLLTGLKSLFSTVVLLFKLGLSLSPVVVSIKAADEAWFLLTDSAHRELRKRQLAVAQKIASVASATIQDINKNPDDYIILSKEVGDALGKISGSWFTEDFLNKSAPEIGEIVGLILGQILFEIILQIVIELTTAGVGNVARGSLAAGQGARGGSRVARIVELLKPLLLRAKGLQRIIRLLMMDERGAAGVEAALAGFNSAERGVIIEVRAILRSPEIAKIRQAAAAGKQAEVTIGGRWIEYVPEMPSSGMTNFEFNGFHIGREAFKSEAEFVKTLLHEIYRLTTSAIRGSGDSAGVASETQAAFQFADRAFPAVAAGR